MQQTIYSYLIILVLLTTACTKTEEQHPTFIPSAGATGWLVPTEQIVFNEGARDQIMAIDEPVFYSFEEASLQPNEKVFIYQANDHIAIYPLEILWHYEIVNDVYQDHYVAVTYCPLTGSGIAWDRTINGKPTTFGVSGHLYNHNLMPYDRATESYWSQMAMQSINGTLSGDALETKPLLITTAAVAKESFPMGSVLYDTSVYVCDSVCLLPKTKSGNATGSTLLSKEEYFGVIFRQYALLFDEDLFADSICVYRTTFKSYNLVIAGSKTKQFITAFLIPTGLSTTSFSPVQDALPVIMKDNNNNLYDLMGNVVEGPDDGIRLDLPPSFWAKSFAWELFYPEWKVYGE